MRRSFLRPAEVCGPHNIDLSPQPERRVPASAIKLFARQMSKISVMCFGRYIFAMHEIVFGKRNQVKQK